jgi:hypothetical protein
MDTALVIFSQKLKLSLPASPVPPPLISTWYKRFYDHNNDSKVIYDSASNGSVGHAGHLLLLKFSISALPKAIEKPADLTWRHG